MTVPRRAFVKLSAGSLAAAALPAAARPPGLRLRLGVVSDIHVRGADDKNLAAFVRALEWFRAQRVDGVILPGDLADDGQIGQLAVVADAWRRVFPDDRGADGARVARLFIYGNHDTSRGETGAGRFNLKKATATWGEAAKAHLLAYNEAAAWRRCFGEDWQPIYATRVKGYVFIGCHWGHEKELDGWLAAHAAALGLHGDRPFFYAQHPHPKDTVNSAHGAYAWGHDDGASTAALAKFPNAVAFSGHSHYPLTNDQTIWQGAFTSVGASSVCYLGWLNGRDNGEWDGSWHGKKSGPVPVARRMSVEARHCLLLDVYDRRLVFARHDLVTGGALGPDWTCPLPACTGAASRPYAFAAAEARATTPAFAPGAAVSLAVRKGRDRSGREGDILAVSFPAARSGGDAGRLIEYEVTAENIAFGFTRIHTQKRVMARGHVHAVAEEANVPPEECLFRLDELPQDTDMRFRVAPLNSFGRRGTAILSAPLRMPPV